ALIVELGQAELHPKHAYTNAQDYRITGTYARLGLDFYMVSQPKSSIYLGLRYAQSQLEDQGTWRMASALYPAHEESFGPGVNVPPGQKCCWVRRPK
ncbi:MAG: hypothetical protein HC915_13615, partial [Anaerolineae bacterium]|nr:hypothetical protein [Anaerolineae bacterium]